MFYLLLIWEMQRCDESIESSQKLVKALVLVFSSHRKRMTIQLLFDFLCSVSVFKDILQFDNKFVETVISIIASWICAIFDCISCYFFSMITSIVDFASLVEKEMSVCINLDIKLHSSALSLWLYFVELVYIRIFDFVTRHTFSVSINSIVFESFRAVVSISFKFVTIFDVVEDEIFRTTMSSAEFIETFEIWIVESILSEMKQSMKSMNDEARCASSLSFILWVEVVVFIVCWAWLIALLLVQ